MVDRATNSAITWIILIANNILYHKNGLESDIQNGSCTHALTQINSAMWKW